MTQPQTMAFHPSSPPSEGGADSYRYEDTPDTRLTSFSPLDSDWSKSSRLLNALTLSTGKADDEFTGLGGPSATLHRMASADSLASVIHDKDPFISSSPEKPQAQAQAQDQTQTQSQTQTQTQTLTKLSATASAFRPLSATPVVAHGTSNSLATPRPLDRFRGVGDVAQSPNTGRHIYTSIPLSHTFSQELGLYRSIRLTCTSGVMTSAGVSEYLTVSTVDHPFLVVQGC